MIQRISDELLLETYVKAVKLKVNSGFIDLLRNEINRRHHLIR